MLEKLRNLWSYATTPAVRTAAVLEAENNELREQVCNRLRDETKVVDILFRDRSLNVGLEGGACRILAESFAEQIVEAGAENYIEVAFVSEKILPGEKLIVTIQRCKGKTPHQFRLEAERRLEALTPKAPSAS